MNRFIAACLVMACFGASAADIHEATLVIQGHRFVPAELKVPAGRKIKLTVVNKDASAEEFESYELNREKVVAGNGRIVVFVGPLDPGKYPYFGEFHMDTAKGTLIAE
ncbi:MAG TPA: cupredoxin domain-containing protein [Luteimonas sp.]|nr:cupredoxin domain-containing protein [Luteimonas sp.]